MPGIRTNRFEGTRGEIRIPSLDVLVARLDRPVLQRRREVATHELGSFDLHAAVSYFNQHLWDDPDYAKVITVFLGKKPLKVLFPAEARLVKMDGAVRIEGVEPEWQQQPSP